MAALVRPTRDEDATLAQLQSTEDARRVEVSLQLQQAQRDQTRLSGERERVERDYRAGGLPVDLYAQLDLKIGVEEKAAFAQVKRLRTRERELSSEKLLA